MKRLLQLGFVIGLVGTIAAAYFVPWVEYTRYLSKTSVVANGGRVEQFMVRLPADRIEPSAAENASGTRLSHFKLRDAEGNVIGLAAKHEITIAGALETAWLLTIPSRGTIALAGTAPVSGSIESIVTAQGLEAGQSLEQGLSIELANPATSVSSTGEFAGIAFELGETWVVTGRDENGRIRGTVQLNTVGRRST
jgi:hypothetical protein